MLISVCTERRLCHENTRTPLITDIAAVFPDPWLLALTASADLTREQALNVARKQVPSSYRLTRADHEAEDMEWEFDFLSKNSRIQFEVTVNEHTSKVIEVERTNLFDLGGRSVDITPAKAKKAVKAKFKKPASQPSGSIPIQNPTASAMSMRSNSGSAPPVGRRMSMHRQESSSNGHWTFKLRQGKQAARSGSLFSYLFLLRG